VTEYDPPVFQNSRAHSRNFVSAVIYCEEFTLQNSCLYSGVFIESALVTGAVCKNSKCIKFVWIDKCVSLKYLMGTACEECLCKRL